MICWFFLVPAGVPVLVSLLLFSFLRKGVLFHHDLLVPPGSGWGSGACLPSFFPQETGSVPSWFAGSSWFRLGFRCLLLSSLVPVLVSLPLSSFFPQETGAVPS